MKFRNNKKFNPPQNYAGRAKKDSECEEEKFSLIFKLRFQATGRQHRGCSIPQAVTHSLVLLKMDKIIARNMLS